MILHVLTFSLPGYVTLSMDKIMHLLKSLFSALDYTPSNCSTLGYNVHRIRSAITVLHNFHTYCNCLHVFLRVRYILEVCYGDVECEYIY